MALKAILQSLEDAPETWRSGYQQQADGTFRLDVEGGFKTADEVTKLHSALEAERKTARDASTKLKAFDGMDPEEVKKAMTAYGNLDAEKKKALEDAEAVHKARMAPVEKERDDAKKEAAEVTGKYHAMLKANTFANVKCIKDLCYPTITPETVFVQMETRGHVHIENDEVVFTDAAGMKILDINGKTDANKAIHQLLTTTAYGQAFIPPPSGSGMHPNAGARAAGTANPWKKETFNLTEQGRILKEDRALAERLAKEAGASLPE